MNRLNPRRLLLGVAAPVLALVVAFLVTSAILLVLGDPVGEVWQTILSWPQPAPARPDRQRRHRLLPLGRRRRGRLPDEPVQHRCRRAVPRRCFRRSARSPGRPGSPARSTSSSRSSSRWPPAACGPASPPTSRSGAASPRSSARSCSTPSRPAWCSGCCSRSPSSSRAATRSPPSRSPSRASSRVSASSRARRTRSTRSSCSRSSSASPTGSSSTRRGSDSTCAPPGGPRRLPWRAVSRCHGWS